MKDFQPALRFIFIDMFRAAALELPDFEKVFHLLIVFCLLEELKPSNLLL